MIRVLNFFRSLDWLMIAAIAVLLAMGLAAIYSTADARPASRLNFGKQLFFSLAGIAVLFLFAALDYRLFRRERIAVLLPYVLGLVLLAGLFLSNTFIRGARSWFSLGPIALQPVEFVKIATLLMLAKYFALRHVEIHQFRHVIVSGLYVGIPAALVLVQPDAGSVIILFLLWLGMLLVAGVRKYHFLLILLLFVAVGAGLWQFGLRDYQRERVLTFLDPARDPLGRGYHAEQSKIAVGSGQLLGKGFGQGSQSRLNFLPEQTTDFIFATIAEEWGFFGVVLLFLALLALFWRMGKVGESCPNNFGRFFASGMLLLIGLEAAVHIAMNIGFFPITGLPLPFVSYGDSSLLATIIGFGILESIRLRSRAFSV
ncbi:rod shape-determining protein RodA [Candidatus Azambacteria bacterium]|nr:rod shape-determining protein RodA [Candidatus Azambacteria bacterium]